MNKKDINFQNKIETIFSGSEPELEKMASSFHLILGRIVSISEREMELLRAMGDQQGLVTEQVKHNTIQHAIKIFDDCYFRSTGERWNPEEDGHA